MPDLVLDPETLPAAWRGVIAWQRDGQWWQPWRLPPDHPHVSFAPELAERARSAAGVRAQVHTDARALTVTIDCHQGAISPLDVLLDGELHARRPLTPARTTTLEVALPGRPAAVELWLPQFGEHRISAVHLAGAATLEAMPPGRPWVTYGSSITQCGSADGPSETWPALVARAQGWDLTCLGFGGQCHLDPIAADAIAQTPAGLVSLCLGVNLNGGSTFSPRALPGRIAGFVADIRAARPAVPVAVISPIMSGREDEPNAHGTSLRQVRDVVEHVVRTLQDQGDDMLHLISGTDVFGATEVPLLQDRVHPSAKGYRHLAQHLRPRLGPLMA